MDSANISEEKTAMSANTTDGKQEASSEQPGKTTSDIAAVTEGVASMAATKPPVKNEPLPWAPDPAEVIQLFDYLQKNKFFTFSWECPGRRNPNEEEKPAPVLTKSSKSFEETEAGADDFDFEEESTPVVRRPTKVLQSTLKGSAKKKTTSFAGILSNMERHRMLDKMNSSGDSGGGS